jgi:hypothetical protein
VDFYSGRVFRLQPRSPAAETLPEWLSQTGCFLDQNAREPAPGVVPFDVRVPFWSDGAVKRRFLALPGGTPATIRPDGTVAFPVGSVLIKEFSLGDGPIETRLMMKYRDGQWTGASYVWDSEGRDAHLVPTEDGLLANIEGVACQAHAALTAPGYRAGRWWTSTVQTHET